MGSRTGIASWRRRSGSPRSTWSWLANPGGTGILTEDGKPLEAPEPASVALLLSDPAIRARVMAVVNSRIHVEQAEGNGLPASPNGGAGARHTAPNAVPATSRCARGLSVEGERCPEVEFAPRTQEGRAVLDAIGRSGVWRRAGMSGHIVGLDMREALGSMPRGLDIDFARASPADRGAVLRPGLVGTGGSDEREGGLNRGRQCRQCHRPLFGAGPGGGPQGAGAAWPRRRRGAAEDRRRRKTGIEDHGLRLGDHGRPAHAGGGNRGIRSVRSARF